MTDKEIKFLALKLKKPTHIEHISKYILKKDILTSKQIIDGFIKDGKTLESPYGKEYYYWIQ